jgi:hypothetical protein
MVRAFELGFIIGRDLVIVSELWYKEPGEAIDCGVNENAAMCEDAYCQGDPVTNKYAIH